MATLEYDITHYQPILFACDGMGELTDRVGGFFAGFDDDTPARIARDAGAAAGVLDKPAAASAAARARRRAAARARSGRRGR